MQLRNGADQWVWYIVGLGWQSRSARLSLLGVSGRSALAGGRMRMGGLKQRTRERRRGAGGLWVVLSVLVSDALPSTVYLCTVLSVCKPCAGENPHNQCSRFKWAVAWPKARAHFTMKREQVLFCTPPLPSPVIEQFSREVLRGSRLESITGHYLCEILPMHPEGNVFFRPRSNLLQPRFHCWQERPSLLAYGA